MSYVPVLQPDLIRNAITAAPELVAEVYFADEDDPEHCPVCVIGALVRALPDDEMRTVAVREALKQDVGSISGGKGHGFSQDLAVTRMALQHAYGLTVAEMQALQNANDNVEEVDADGVHHPGRRREAVLKVVDDIVLDRFVKAA